MLVMSLFTFIFLSILGKAKNGNNSSEYYSHHPSPFLQAKMSRQYVIDAATFDVNNLVVEESKLKKIVGANGKSGINMYTSAIKYRLRDGSLTDVFLRGPQGFTYGIQRTYTMNSEETEENAKGWQMSYIVGGMDTDLTPNEKSFFECLDSIRASVGEQIVTHVKNKCQLPQVTVNAFKHCRSADEASEQVKPLYTYPRNEKTKEFDTTKSPRMYVKLATTGKRGESIVTTFLDTERQRIHSPVETMFEARGKILPVFRLKSIWYGSHGETGVTASVQYDLAQARFEAVGGGLPTEDLTGDDVLENNAENPFGDAPIPKASAPRADEDDKPRVKKSKPAKAAPPVEEEEATEEKVPTPPRRTTKLRKPE